MSDTVVNALIAAVVALVVAVLAPRLNWSIKEKELLRSDRRKQVDQWRTAVNLSADSRIFVTTPEYSALRPLLTKEERHNIEGVGTITVVMKSSRQPRWNTYALDAIARIEREWGLI